MTRKALGRGLSALLREVETSSTGVDQVALDLIDPNPFQPRRAFAAEALKELADSIRATGLIQPVLLRRTGARYQLVAGERRWRAAQLAGLPKLPAIVRELSDKEALELSLTENLLRQDLNAIEVAHAYSSLQEQFKLSHEEIADRLGIKRVTVTNTLRLLRLAPSIQEMIGRGEISAGHARALLGLESAAAQAQLARLIIQQGLSVRQVENMVALREAKAPARPPEAASAKVDPNIRAARIELERTLGTRVKIVGDEKRGKIEISYFSADDLNRIYEIIVKR